MGTRDICQDVAAIKWPGPDAEGSEELRPGLFAEMQAAAAAEQRDHADDLKHFWDTEGNDPLLAMLAATRSKMIEAEADLRRLIAYGREFVQPRPYTLEDLARAAGMSISGVRTAYDDDEIAEVARRTGLKPRRATT